MGRDNHNAGIHMIPWNQAGRNDSVDAFDRHTSIIAEQRMKENVVNKRSIISDVTLCNFVFLEPKRGEKKRCLCGGTLKYKNDLRVKFHNGNGLVSILLTGKQCEDCERKVFVENEVVDKILEVKSRQRKEKYSNSNQVRGICI